MIKVDLLMNMLRQGELDDKGVEFDISLAEKVDKEVYFIKAGKYIPMKFAPITQGPTGFFKSLELSAKFETEIERYSFMNIPNAGAGEKKEFLKQFAEVVVAEKRRQLLHYPTGQTNLPWSVTNVWTMPVVIWLRKGQ